MFPASRKCCFCRPTRIAGPKADYGIKAVSSSRVREKPSITVITVVRNQTRDIATTIESVLGRSYDHVEYIVIDGCSTDGTVDVIRRYDHAIDYWVSRAGRRKSATPSTKGSALRQGNGSTS